jgi:Peptidase family M28
MGMMEKRGRYVFWIVLIMLVLMAALAIAFMTAMPGKSYAGPLPSLSDEQAATSANLKKHVTYLAGTIGERNVIAYQNLESACQYIKDSLDALGYGVRSQEYTVQMRKVQNLIAEIPGSRRPGEIVIIGAHYDTVYDCPGADDNSSGVAGLLELARLLRRNETARTLRFVAFVNEEPPWFQTEAMGSWVYAKQARRLHENIVATVSIESIGVYADAEGSQKYPAGFGALYPSKGNFISFVGNVESRKLVRAAIRSFRQTTNFPRREQPFLERFQLSAGRITGPSGRPVIRRSWSPTRLLSGTRTTICQPTHPRLWTTIVWREWCMASRRL